MLRVCTKEPRRQAIALKLIIQGEVCQQEQGWGLYDNQLDSDCRCRLYTTAELRTNHSKSGASPKSLPPPPKPSLPQRQLVHVPRQAWPVLEKSPADFAAGESRPRSRRLPLRCSPSGMRRLRKWDSSTAMCWRLPSISVGMLQDPPASSCCDRATNKPHFHHRMITSCNGPSERRTLKGSTGPLLRTLARV